MYVGAKILLLLKLPSPAVHCKLEYCEAAAPATGMAFNTQKASLPPELPAFAIGNGSIAKVIWSLSKSPRQAPVPFPVRVKVTPPVAISFGPGENIAFKELTLLKVPSLLRGFDQTHGELLLCVPLSVAVFAAQMVASNPAFTSGN